MSCVLCRPQGLMSCVLFRPAAQQRCSTPSRHPSITPPPDACLPACSVFLSASLSACLFCLPAGLSCILPCPALSALSALVSPQRYECAYSTGAAISRISWHKLLSTRWQHHSGCSSHCGEPVQQAVRQVSVLPALDQRCPLPSRPLCQLLRAACRPPDHCANSSALPLLVSYVYGW